MSATTRVVDFPGAQLRATEVKGDKGLFTNVVINNVLAEAATQTLDQVTANGATTTRAISITNARPGLTQTDAALCLPLDRERRRPNEPREEFRQAILSLGRGG